MLMFYLLHTWPEEGSKMQLQPVTKTNIFHLTI